MSKRSFLAVFWPAILWMIFTTAAHAADGPSNGPSLSPDGATSGASAAAATEALLRLEAEDGVLTATYARSSGKGYSGKGYVTGFTAEKSAVTVKANVPSGIYDVYIGYRAQNGDKTCSLLVNDVPAGDVVLKASSSFVETPAGKVQLAESDSSIKIAKNWGWYDIDYIRLSPATITPKQHQVTTSLNNPNASKEAKAVMGYLVSMYGKKILSGQQDDSNIAWLKQNTGKAPAICGFDLIDYTPSRVEHGSNSSEVDKAIAWWKRGGLVTFCWHWNAPVGLIDKPGKEWWRGFYTDATTFDISKTIQNPTSSEYKLLVRDIDAIAVQLKRLQAAGVPVLWRPLHEASGGWFWWGAKGAEPCKKLYMLLYDRLTNYHKLNNLIWIWNSPEASWYPGDNYVDVISIDSYPKAGDYSPVVSSYDGLVSLVNDKKLVAMTENGPIPDPDKLVSFGAGWSWFCTWTGDFVTDGKSNSLEHIKRVYNSDYVITLDELPNLRGK